MSTPFSNLKAEAKSFFPFRITNPKETVMKQFNQWGFQA